MMIKPDPDSHFRLRRCTCGGEPVYAGGDNGWAVRCPDCGRKSERHLARHDAQVAWNREAAA